MPSVLSVHEAKTHFSSILAEVENNMESVTIVRYGRPVAQLVPLRKNKRNFAPIPQIAGKIDVKCDLFGDDSGDLQDRISCTNIAIV